MKTTTKTRTQTSSGRDPDNLNENQFNNNETTLQYICCKSGICRISLSVKCIFRKTIANRFVVKQCIMLIADCDAQCNQKLRIVIIDCN